MSAPAGAAIALVLLVWPSLSVASADDPGRVTEDLFDSAGGADVLELAEESEREALAESLEDAGRNWSELAAGIRRLEGEERAAAVWLVNGAPHLDRLEMTSETLVEHVQYAFRARGGMPYSIPNDRFRPYILTYRIGEEPVVSWRRELFERYEPVARQEGDVTRTARAVNRDLSENISEREREFFGPTQSPLLTLRSGSGTESEIAILACAIMKAIGIPSRQASVRALGAEEGGESWIEIFDGEKWLPLYPLEPSAFGDFGFVEREHTTNVTVVSTRSAFERVLTTENYTDTGVIELSFVLDGAPAAGYEHFSISVLNRGALVPLDSLEAVADEDGRFMAVVGDGRYVVLGGLRDGSGNAFVTMSEAVVEPGGRRVLAFDVTPRESREAPNAEQVRSLGRVLDAVVLFDIGSEPDVRMLPLIAAALARRSLSVEATYVSVGGTGEGGVRAEDVLPLEATVVLLGPGEASYLNGSGRTIEIPPGEWEGPIVTVFERESGAEVLAHSGYDLNIDRKLSVAVDGYLKELAAR